MNVHSNSVLRTVWEPGTGCPLVNTDDSDGDGVYDDVDSCPETSVFETVDANGCADSQLDDDEDGVSNANDICPETDEDDDVDSNGCSDQLVKDSDGDGVFDIDDLCPIPPLKLTLMVAMKINVIQTVMG